MLGDDANVFLNIADLQRHAVHSVHSIAGIAAGLFRPDAGPYAARLGFARDLNFLAEEVVELVAHVLQRVYSAGSVFYKDVISSFAAQASAHCDCAVLIVGSRAGLLRKGAGGQ